MALKQNTSLVDTYNQTVTKTEPDEVIIGNVNVGSGTTGTGRGILAGNSVTISSPPSGNSVASAGGNSSQEKITKSGVVSTNNNSMDFSSSFTSTSTGSPTFDFAMSDYGDLELTKYLYESGLQNIFTDYQKNIQTLQQQEAQQLQQAYAVRELSKKYLGEYASNVGIGDVSGNLIDIYSNYVANITDIEQNFAALEMNLTREYTNERMQTFNKLLQAQYDIDVAQLESVAADASQYVFTEYDRDVAGGLAYLESQRENMRPQDYEAIKDAYYQSNVDGIIQNLASASPWFGFSDLESKTVKTQEQYLQEAKQWMQPQDYARLEEVIAFKEFMAQNEGDLDFGDPLQGFDPTLFSSSPYVSSNSEVYEFGGSRWAVADVSVSNDDVFFNSGETPQTLDEAWVKQSEQDIATLGEGDILRYKGLYIYQDGEWRRMINISAQEQPLNFGTFNPRDPNGQLPEGFEVDFNYGSKNLDAVTYQGRTYVEDINVGDYKDNLNATLNGVPMTEIIAHLNGLFGGSSESGPGFGDVEAEGEAQSNEVFSYVPQQTIFEYKNRLYVYTKDGKKIRPLNLETKTT